MGRIFPLPVPRTTPGEATVVSSAAGSPIHSAASPLHTFTPSNPRRTVSQMSSPLFSPAPTHPAGMGTWLPMAYQRAAPSALPTSPSTGMIFYGPDPLPSRLRDRGLAVPAFLPREGLVSESLQSRPRAPGLTTPSHPTRDPFEHPEDTPVMTPFKKKHARGKRGGSGKKRAKECVDDGAGEEEAVLATKTDVRYGNEIKYSDNSDLNTRSPSPSGQHLWSLKDLDKIMES